MIRMYISIHDYLARLPSHFTQLSPYFSIFDSKNKCSKYIFLNTDRKFLISSKICKYLKVEVELI